ncbi:MAG: hypothetical protein LUD68_09590 [Rikenellaceae bacterium]|nr:hypothetical protein [Rikenellaceae bacterium]
MDEPSNHLDNLYREQLYGSIRNAAAALLIVSHDRTLLNLADTILELSPRGVTAYGGNYEFYQAQQALQLTAARDHLAEREKRLRAAQKPPGKQPGAKKNRTRAAKENSTNKAFREF